ncbi:LysR family transcriptional regulator [Pseudooctadecabacter jejudonensis]|nr:LysR family transcriptional regulator [Pseudooctadecabacter jejudonensis]
MDIDPNRLDWNHLRAFMVTAEAQSLSAAARILGLTQPTLSRQVAALEDRLGLLLFERVGRGLALTDAGREVLTHVQPMGHAAHSATIAASAQRSDLTGWVKITASDIMSATLLPAVISAVRKTAPQLQVEVVATNDISDLMRREADIAIRHMRPEEPDLVARMVREAKGYFYANRSYLDRVGRPNTRADMAKMDWVAYGNIDRMVEYMTGLDIPLTPDNFRTSSADGLVAWEMGRAGLGICPMDESVGAAAPEMEALLPETLQVAFPVWLVAHRELHTSPKIRLVFDMLADAIAAR